MEETEQGVDTKLHLESEFAVPVRITSLEYSSEFGELDPEPSDHHPERHFDGNSTVEVFEVLHWFLLVFVEVVAMAQGLQGWQVPGRAALMLHPYYTIFSGIGQNN
jgi:hypothetical protein